MELAGYIATLTLICILLTTLLIWWQAGEATRTRKLDAMMRVHDKVSSTQARKDRALLLKLSEHSWATPPEALPEDEREAVERVCVDADIVGSLVKCKLVPEKEFLQYHFDVIIKTYEAAGPFIQWRRKRSVTGHYVPAFQWLYGRAKSKYGTATADARGRT